MREINCFSDKPLSPPKSSRSDAPVYGWRKKKKEVINARRE
jgi:hypothetical protein